MIRDTVRLFQGPGPTRVVSVTRSDTEEFTTFLVDDPPHAVEAARGLLASVRAHSKGDGAAAARTIANGLIRQVLAPMPDGRLCYLYALALGEALGSRHAVVEVGDARNGPHPIEAGDVEEAREAVEAWMQGVAAPARRPH